MTGRFHADGSFDGVTDLHMPSPPCGVDAGRLTPREKPSGRRGSVDQSTDEVFPTAAQPVFERFVLSLVVLRGCVEQEGHL